MTEYEVVLKAKDGDSEAVSILWEKYFPMVQKYKFKIIRLGKNEHDAEDFEQEAYLSFLDGIDKVDVSKIKPNFQFGQMMSWSLQALRNSFVRKASKELKNVHHKNSFDEWFEEAPSSDSESLRVPSNLVRVSGTSIFYRYRVDHEELHFDLEAKKEEYFSRLSAHQKKILILRQEGKTIDEISSVIGKSYSYVRTNIVKAKKIANAFFEVNYA